jgi:hypothetical protein
MRPLAALVAMVALLIAYDASPARAADGCTTTAGTTTCTFTPTGAEQTFQVPDGVSSVHVVATGAPGAVGVNSRSAGSGAQVSGDLTVEPGQTLYVNVGGAPTGKGTSACDPAVNCIGGFNGGGGTSLAFAGGGGGGASDVRTVPRVTDGSLGSRLIVAGGGGSGWGRVLNCANAVGGSGGDAGFDGGNGDSCAIAGGTGGKAGSTDGQNGSLSLGQGGDGGASSGGGGGGGYYGGGGGGISPACFTCFPTVIAPAGGGGGGSSLVPTGGSGPSITSDNPSIIISYTSDTIPPTLSVTHTADGTGGWNITSPVTVNVSASDSGSGLAGDPTCKGGTTDLPLTAGTAGTWTTSVSGDGTHTISCSVTDKAGNQTTASDTVMIDTKAPTVSCSVTPSKLSAPANNHKLVTVTASVSVTDIGGSGTDPIFTKRFTLVSVTSNQAQSGLASDDVPNDIQGWTTGRADTSGQVRAERYGTARTYTLTYQGKDLAGNTKNCQAMVTVPKGG